MANGNIRASFVHHGTLVTFLTWRMDFVHVQVKGGKLADNPGFKPVYRDLITERVQYNWVGPAEQEKDYTEASPLTAVVSS